MKTMILLLFFLSGCATPTISNASVTGPIIYFSYSALFDRVCEKISGKAILTAAKIEGQRRLSEFASQWQKDSPDFFKVLTAKLGRNFIRKEETVSLTSCNIPSVSDPVLIPLKRWLVSLGGNEPLYGFSDVVFHELLHRYLNSNFDANRSLLLKKYSSENAEVLTHLHLMALQKMIYTELKREDLLTWLDHDYNDLIGGDYKRAWRIVNLESYQSFVAELAVMAK